MRIFDCFLYNNEDLILDIRLNSLDQHIYKFVIVESKFDHQGNEKKINFKIENFQKFKDKIIYLIIEKFPKNLSNWGRENYQREFILNGLVNAKDDDYIMISDIDEIPNVSNLNSIENYKFSVFEQKMFYYKINLQNMTEPLWYGSRICKKKYLKSITFLRKKIKLENMKKAFWKLQYEKSIEFIENGGWHFNNLYNPEIISKKLQNIKHVDKGLKNVHLDRDIIEKKIFNLEDVFHRNHKYEKIEIDETFPDYIRNNLSIFTDFILE